MICDVTRKGSITVVSLYSSITIMEIITNNADFYFAHPYSSWERGLSDYTNKLIRQWLPKKTDFKTINNKYINQITLKLNRRPRKKSDYKTPIKHLLTNFNPKVAFAC